ncbi:hypothetical protein WA026_004867 [Henosepilachna vigintioctopunctata]|uniref:Uncharacterized protein n=1 Tax=Henosepilachna vigintioctopunctata TaxID=420089 RepID=A0AAW1UTW2_9CUCU
MNNETNLRLVAEINLNNRKTTFFQFVVGQNERSTQSAFLNAEISNTPLQEAQYYIISILLVNNYKKKYTTSVYSIRYLTLGRNEEPSGRNSGYYALLLLLMIPIILGVMFYYRKKYLSSPSSSLNKMMEAVIKSETISIISIYNLHLHRQI